MNDWKRWAKRAVPANQGFDFCCNLDVENLKELDPENLELLQEQAALQRAITESNTKSTVQTKSPQRNLEKGFKSSPQDRVISEEEALQRAIYESTHEASSPKPVKNDAAAPPKSEHHNWLRMSSLQDVSPPG